MTVGTVSIIITIKAGTKSKEITKSIELEQLDKETASLGQGLSGKVFELILNRWMNCWI